MRKTSYLLLAMGLLSPFIAAWFVQRSAAQYRAKFSMEPEGMGFFAIVASAALAAFVLFSASAIYAARSYRRLEEPRPVLRKIELALICVTPVLVVLFVYFGMLGGPYDPPQQIVAP